ncbi:type II toxin-antitoxin system VapC family toxin, partial [Candidatus Woesearchaeota archaeon]|nr:type II toxin-antitoxin system VapC family toxin [Candidatus Woesearchaeota archaeon]
METKKLKGGYVLDSSVVIKWFCEEEGTEVALAVRNDFGMGNAKIAVPDLQLYEIANALRYNKKLNETDVVDAVNSLITMGIMIVAPTKRVMNAAISLSYDYDLTVYDAYFVALAQDLEFSFVTSDKTLYRKIEKLKGM